MSGSQSKGDHGPFVVVNRWRNQERSWMNIIITHWSYRGLRRKVTIKHIPSPAPDCWAAANLANNLPSVGQNISNSQILKAVKDQEDGKSHMLMNYKLLSHKGQKKN